MPRTPLVRIFGSSPRVEILELMATYAGEELTVPFIREHIETSSATIYTYIKELVNEGLVLETEKIGSTHYYQLNQNDRWVKSLIGMHNFGLADEIADQIHAIGEDTLSEKMQKLLQETQGSGSNSELRLRDESNNNLLDRIEKSIEKKLLMFTSYSRHSSGDVQKRDGLGIGISEDTTNTLDSTEGMYV